MAGISTASSSVVTAQPELSIHDGKPLPPNTFRAVFV